MSNYSEIVYPFYVHLKGNLWYNCIESDFEWRDAAAEFSIFEDGISSVNIQTYTKDNDVYGVVYSYSYIMYR